LTLERFLLASVLAPSFGGDFFLDSGRMNWVGTASLSSPLFFFSEDRLPFQRFSEEFFSGFPDWNLLRFSPGNLV